MDILEQRFYKLNYRLLSFLGLWPYQKSRLRRMHIINIALLSFNMTQFLKMFTSKGNFGVIIEVIPIWTTMMNVAIKYHTYNMGIVNIEKLLNNMIIDWQTWKSKEEVKIMEEYAQQARFYTIAYAINIYFTAMLFLGSAFVPCILDVIAPLNASRPLKPPILVEYLVDQEEHFYPIYVHMCLTVTLSVTTLVVADTQLMIFASHVCSVFAVIGFRLEHFLKDACTVDNWTKRQRKKYIDNLALSINGHKRALEFVDRIESSFQYSLLVQCGFNIMCMSISLYRIAITIEEKSIEVLRYIIFLIAQLFHIFCTCYSGQRIMNHSSDVAWKAYSSMWYDAPVEINKLLLLVIRRSQETSQLTAGKIFVFCFESFSTILQTSTSYFMVLSSVQ
ncbi:hypothetical protein KPH14_003012 [Odynerus spinipes]|uniref:Odorant receptor n=1 Tax=Odynerus spinipes TaxID=1348599 RepID=A0AAD9RWN4_9HYME|nr:hypothetical protein KPH14_003012 [Odynerus spinipes]